MKAVRRRSVRADEKWGGEREYLREKHPDGLGGRVTKVVLCEIGELYRASAEPRSLSLEQRRAHLIRVPTARLNGALHAEPHTGSQITSTCTS